MLQETIYSEMEVLLGTIKEQYSHIKSQQEHIHQIELDILLANIAKLYEHVQLLKNKNQIGPLKQELLLTEISASDVTKKVVEAEPAPITRLNEKSPIVSFVVRPCFTADMPKPGEPIEPVAEMKKEVMDTPVASLEQKVTTIEKEIIKEDIQDIMRQTDKTQSGIQQAKQAPVTTRKPTVQSMGLFDGVNTIGSQFQEQATLHDKFSKNKTDSSLGKKLQNKPVEDLKKSIGINEKFSFINELFEGDLNNYNKAIDSLNQSGGLEEAMRFIHEQLLPKYAWNQETKSYRNLTDLIERRFMK